MPSPSRREISNPAQLRALASPARQELVDLLARTGPATAGELGRLIGRPADGLYYHLRALERAGLIASGIARPRGGRGERVFRAAHREPALRHDPGSEGNSRAVAAIVAAMLRLGIRDFRKACASADVRTHGPRRELWALRVTGRLSPGELANANRRMRDLRDTLGRRRVKGDLYAVTILLTPLGHRARKKQRRPRPPAKRSRP
jgi:DNA-binding transcriptional ArsR family regulator